MGQLEYQNRTYDLALIDADGWHVVFDGSSTTSNKKNVLSWGYWVANELVCQSGMTSGTVCGIKQIKSVDRNESCDPGQAPPDCGYIVKGLIYCVQIDGATAARDGDSGGSVFTLDGTGVRAKGISIGVGTATEFYFQDLSDVIREFGMYPNVSNSLY